MKRQNGEGTCRFDETQQRYEFKITYTDPITNKAKRKTFTSTKSRAEAMRKAKKFKDSLCISTTQQPEVFTLSTWLDQWIENIAKTVKPKTLERYKCLINVNIKPYALANEVLAAVTANALQKHFNGLLAHGGASKQGLSPRTVNATRRLIIGALDSAILEGVIQMNIAKFSKPIKAEQPQLLVLTHEQGKTLIRKALQRSRFSWAIVVLGLGTGMRIGEIFGLEWKNVDLEKKTLMVERTVVTTRSGKLVQDSGKTKTSRRTILLTDNVCYMLKRLKLWQKVMDRRLGTHYSTSPWVLTNPQGNPRSPSSFSGHDFKQLLEAAGIDRRFRIHDMRHTHATWLLEKGVNVKAVSERLGHSNIRITLDTYAHIGQSLQEEAVKKLNEIF